MLRLEEETRKAEAAASRAKAWAYKAGVALSRYWQAIKAVRDRKEGKTVLQSSLTGLFYTIYCHLDAQVCVDDPLACADSPVWLLNLGNYDYEEPSTLFASCSAINQTEAASQGWRVTKSESDECMGILCRIVPTGDPAIYPGESSEKYWGTHYDHYVLMMGGVYKAISGKDAFDAYKDYISYLQGDNSVLTGAEFRPVDWKEVEDVLQEWAILRQKRAEFQA